MADPGKEIKLEDFNGDGKIDAKDRKILAELRRKAAIRRQKNAKIRKNKKNVANMLNAKSSKDLNQNK